MGDRPRNYEAADLFGAAAIGLIANELAGRGVSGNAHVVRSIYRGVHIPESIVDLRSVNAVGVCKRGSYREGAASGTYTGKRGLIQERSWTGCRGVLLEGFGELKPATPVLSGG